MNNGKKKAMLLSGAVALCTAAGAMGTTVNLLNAGSTGTINGARFETWDMGPTTTGTLNPFLALHGNGASQGHNTSGRPLRFNEENSANTRNIQFKDLMSRNVNGTDYFEILLDANEPSSVSQSTVSLDQLILYTSAVGSRTTGTVATLGTVRYNLDEGGNNNIMLRDMNSGPGVADARILIPVSAFEGTSGTDYVYLFARFGDAAAAQGGGEVFSINGVNLPASMPLPTASGLAITALMGLGAFRRR
jgi:hypothetical protein